MEFSCPRCQTSAVDDYYGPCATCRSDLVAKFSGLGRAVRVAEYEPKINVTPNAVALKDD
ncbi:MAG: hypothetical protein P8J30_05080 [Ilumatobacter sp.]|nr:hypothetical protein [Ilumatobacter sp.]